MSCISLLEHRHPLNKPLEPDHLDPLLMFPLNLLLRTFLKHSLMIPLVPHPQPSLHLHPLLPFKEHLQLIVTHLRLHLPLIPLRSVLLRSLLPALKRPFSQLALIDLTALLQSPLINPFHLKPSQGDPYLLNRGVQLLIDISRQTLDKQVSNSLEYPERLVGVSLGLLVPQVEGKGQHGLCEEFGLPELEGFYELGAAGHPVVEGGDPLGKD